MNTWIDNMGTGIMQLQGTWDAASKTINFTGTSVDPSTGKDMNIRETLTLVDNNTQMMIMYMTQSCKEYKSMEIKFSGKM